MSIFALGIEVDGKGNDTVSIGGKTLSRRVTAAENAGFTFVTFDDSVVPPSGQSRGRVDAVNRASFVAATTSTVGLVPVVGTTYAEPFHTSSQLATLDYSSRGRAGWIAARVDDAAAARAWGRPLLTDAADLDREQRDSITVAQALWDSWEDDAVIRHYPSGRFLDREKLHYVDFEGESFTVKGPAIVPRPPQGQVVVFGSEADRDLVDVVLGRDVPETRSEKLTFVEIDFADTEPADFVEVLTDLASKVDGVRILPSDYDNDLPILSRYVLPALVESGVAHRPVPGSTFRANLGLTRPVNRYEKV